MPDPIGPASRGGFTTWANAETEAAFNQLTAEQLRLYLGLRVDAQFGEPTAKVDRFGRRLLLEPGEVLFSLDGCARRYGMSVDQVRRAVRRFEQLGFLSRRQALEPATPPATPGQTFPATGQGRDAATPPTVLRFLTDRDKCWHVTGPATGGEDAPATAPATPPRVKAAPIQQENQRNEPENEGAPAASPPRSGSHSGRAKKAIGSDPRHAPLTAALVAAYEQQRGVKYGFDRERDPPAIARLLKLGSDDQVVAAWRAALVAEPPFLCDTIAQLASPRVWNRMARSVQPAPLASPCTTPSPADATWSRISAQLRARLRGDLYERWIAPLRAESRGADLVLEAPDDFFARFLEDNYRVVLTGAARDFGGVAGEVFIRSASHAAGAAA